MSRKISDLTAGVEIYIDEINTDGETYDHIPYIYLGLDECNNAIVLRKYCYASGKLNETDVGKYDECLRDTWLNNESTGFISRLNASTLNSLANTTIKYSDYTETGVITSVSITRRCFLLSRTEVGYASDVDEGISYLGALKTYYNTTVDNTARTGKDTTETARIWWLRSGASTTQFCNVSSNGTMGAWTPSYTAMWIRPALSIDPNTLVTDEGAEQIALLPTGEINSWVISASMSLGKTPTRPKRCKLSVPMDVFDSAQFWVCNNFMDTTPTWVSCTNGGTAIFGTTKTAVSWELGVKVYATAQAINRRIGEPAMIVELEPEEVIEI